MINSYIKSLKLAKYLIVTISSSPTLPASLQPAEKPFNQTRSARSFAVFIILFVVLKQYIQTKGQ